MDATTNKLIIDTILPYKPIEIGVFGSYARNEMTEDSDIDILVDLNPEVSLLDIGGLYMDLLERLGRNVDLVTKGGINEMFRKYIEQDFISIYRES